MLTIKKPKGFTLIELLIVIAIIGILAAIALPMYNANRIRARLVEVTNAMAQISSAVGLYCQDVTAGGGGVAFPNCPDIPSLRSSLGIGLDAVTRISAAQVDPNTGVVQVTLSNIDPAVDNSTLSLRPQVSVDGSIKWVWEGTIPLLYLPKDR